MLVEFASIHTKLDRPEEPPRALAILPARLAVAPKQVLLRGEVTEPAIKNPMGPPLIAERGNTDNNRATGGGHPAAVRAAGDGLGLDPSRLRIELATPCPGVGGMEASIPSGRDTARGAGKIRTEPVQYLRSGRLGLPPGNRRAATATRDRTTPIGSPTTTPDPPQHLLPSRPLPNSAASSGSLPASASDRD